MGERIALLVYAENTSVNYIDVVFHAGPERCAGLCCGA